MILHPQKTPLQPKTTDYVPAWEAILRAQKSPSDEWLLVTQADHAALAGEMARSMSGPDFPALEPEVIRAIAVHDDGWKQVDTDGVPKTNARNRPLSFLDEAPADIFRAWQGSIASGTGVAPIAGILVSEHFCRIARESSRAAGTPPETAQALTTFIERELAQQEDLREQQSRNAEQIESLVDVLQFFDLLSLYLCCGSQENIGFPQRWNEKTFHLSREGDVCRLQPALFTRPTQFSIRACKYPASDRESTVTISVLVA